MTEIKLREYNYYSNSDTNVSKNEYGFMKTIDNDIIKSWGEYNYVIIEGEYKATVTRCIPYDCFGWLNWKQSRYIPLVRFYKNDIEIFTHESQGGIVILHTINNITRFLIICDDMIQIYDMDNNIIYSDISVGMDQFVDFKRVSNKYAIGLTEETCTYDPCGSIWDLDHMMFGMNTKEVNYYSDHRMPIPLCGKCDCGNNWWNRGRINIKHFHPRYIPISALDEGFKVWDTYENKLLDNIVSYDHAYTGIFDFDPAYIDPLKEVSKMCGRTVEELENEMRQNDGKLSFKFSTYEGPN